MVGKRGGEIFSEVLKLLMNFLTEILINFSYRTRNNLFSK